MVDTPVNTLNFAVEGHLRLVVVSLFTTRCIATVAVHFSTIHVLFHRRRLGFPI